MKARYCILLMLVVSSCSNAPELAATRTGHEGELMPSFRILQPDSILYSTVDHAVGRPSLLFYFLPTCPYCRMEMRRIVNNMDKLKGMDFIVVTTAGYLDMYEFYKEYRIEKYRNVRMGLDMEGFFASYFMANNVPFLAIYDRHKKLKSSYNGAMETEQLVKMVGL
ncbi:MAG: redoxin family protein [Pseudosphingobacterium sp.]|nr:redoxin family protein [Pseudosphingobacterium sp.]